MFTIHNQKLTAVIDEMGAQLMSLKAADGTEYLWQGDPRFWKGRAPVMFPWVGRLYGGCYQHRGKTYEMGIHGFARVLPFVCTAQSESALTMTLTANEETKAQYPFDFRFDVTYALQEDTLQITFGVENTGNETMYYAWGGHPGFNVPLEKTESFEDYRLEFGTPCRPDQTVFTENVLLSGQTKPFLLEEGRYRSIAHDLFDNDAIFLTHMAKSVTLRSQVSGRGVCLRYPDMAHLGLWHAPKTQAPYMCIEPWSALPAREGVTEELSCRSDLMATAPGEQNQTTWSIQIL